MTAFFLNAVVFFKNAVMFLKKTVVFMSKGFGVGKLFGCRNIHHPVEVVTQKVKLPVLVVYVVSGNLWD